MKEYFRVTYQLRIPNVDSPEFQHDLETMAGLMARDGSFGTWTHLDSIPNIRHISDEYGAYVEYADTETGTFTIKFPAENIDFIYGHVTLLLNTIAGDILGLSGIEQAKVIHIDYPSSWLASFGGPTCGVKGIRDLLGVHDRPLVAFSIKPRLGLDVKQTAEIVAQAVSGGVDIVEDDERMINPSYCPIEDRVKAVREAIDKVTTRTSKIYSVNVSCRPDKVIELVEKVLNAGANALKIDVLATGFPALSQVADYVRDLGRPVPLFVYPALYRVFESTIRREVLLELSRYMGADIIYAGSLKKTGRMDVVDSIIRLRHHHELLLRPIDYPKKLERTMPSISTNVHPGTINYLFRAVHHKDFAFFIGGGIAGNPLGVEKGANLIMKVLDNVNSNPSFGSDEFFRLLNKDEREALDKMGWNYLDWETETNQFPSLKVL